MDTQEEFKMTFKVLQSMLSIHTQCIYRPAQYAHPARTLLTFTKLSRILPAFIKEPLSRQLSRSIIIIKQCCIFNIYQTPCGPLLVTNRNATTPCGLRVCATPRLGKSVNKTKFKVNKTYKHYLLCEHL